jgi:hypothetical protein
LAVVPIKNCLRCIISAQVRIPVAPQA